MRVLLGSIVVELRAIGRSLDFVPHTLSGFVVDGSPVVTVEVAVDGRAFADHAELLRSASRIDEHSLVVELHENGFFSALDLRARHVEARLPRPSPRFVDTLLRQVLQLFALVDRSGLLLHASAVETGGKAVLFTGRAEAGKSTAARLAKDAGAEFLADDVVFVELDDPPMVHCLPFLQRTDGPLRPRTAPLGAIYAVTQSGGNRVERLHATERLRRLTVATTLAVKHPLFVRPLLEMDERLNSLVPVRALHFRKGRDFWNVVLDDLESLTV